MKNFVSEYVAVWLVITLGLSLSIASFLVIEKQLGTHRNAEFTWVANNHNRLVELGIKNVLNLMQVSIENFEALNLTSLSHLQQVSNALLKSNSSIDLIVSFNSKFNPTQTSKEKFIVEAMIQDKNTLFSACFSVDIPSEVYDVLEDAAKTGKVSISQRLACQEQGGTTYAIMVVFPLTHNLPNNKPEHQINRLIGAIINLDELTNLAISHLEPRGVDLLIQDESEQSDKQLLKYYASRLHPDRNFYNENDIVKKFSYEPRQISEYIKLANRHWSITAIPTNNFRSAQAYESQAWAVLVAGVSMTLLLAIYLLRAKMVIKERVKMNQLLKDREELFWQMTETVDELFWAINTENGCFLYLSPAYEKLWGLKCDLTYEKPQLFIAGIYSHDRQIWLNAIKHIKQTSEPCEIYYRIVQKTGSQRWLKDNLFPVTNQKGQLYRLVGVAEDITEKKKAEDLLRDSEQKLRTLFKQSPDTIMTVDRNGIILLSNHGIKFESSNTVGIQRDSACLFPEPYRVKYLDLLNKAFTDAEASYLPYQPDKSTWREIRLIPIIEGQQVHTVMVISTDITEKHHLEVQAIHNARLAHIGTMATGIAHDINNPNNAINTAATLLGHVWKDALPVFREYHQEHGDFSLGGLSFASEGNSLGELFYEISENSQRISAIISNLKQLGQADQGGLEEKININTILRKVEKLLGSNITKYTSCWQMKLAQGELWINGNFRQLEQVIINIILNALQSLSDKSRSVLVESETDEETIVIRISDEGIGIEAKDIDRVKDPFFTTRQNRGGTGLGLYLSQLIINKHKGRIDISSTDKGTVVSIILPAYNMMRKT